MRNMINIIAKLMNEEVETTEIAQTYDQLYDYIYIDFPDVLDKGEYIENSTILRRVQNILKKYEIFKIIPELVEKSVSVIMGNSYAIEKQLLSRMLTECEWVKWNNNLPMVIVNAGEKGKNIIFALTYSDKLVEINVEEFRLITQELYKVNIEIQKLIKGFVVYTDFAQKDLALLLVPEYANLSNELYRAMKHFVVGYYLIQDEQGKWKKIKEWNQRIGDRISILTEGFQESEKEFNELNRPCVNFAITNQLRNALLDVISFYSTNRNDLGKKIESLAKDSLGIASGEVKLQVQLHREKHIMKRNQFSEKEKEFQNASEEILSRALEYENMLSETLQYDVPDVYLVKHYIKNLLELFFKHLAIQCYEEAKEDIEKLYRVNYNYILALYCMMDYAQQVEVSQTQLQELREYPSDDWAVTKIKIEMSSVLGYKTADIEELVSKLPRITTGKEWFYLGKFQTKARNYIQASKSFMNALDLNYMKAGKELMKLAKKHPECEIEIEELAENLIPEANYFVGRENINAKYKKGVVNLKMAASKEYEDAIVIVAKILFEKCKKLSKKKMEEEENIQAVNNVIKLYSHLAKKKPNENYNLPIGLMYCKLNDYARAFEYLKELEDVEAQYECAKMYQNGNGVAKNITTAKKMYKNIMTLHKDAEKQYKKIVNQQVEEKEKREKKQSQGYSSDRNYSSSSYTSYSGSDWCFITTAACLALHETKDCEQLNVLRRFRDEHILNDGSDGNDLVKEYYRIGPIIVSHIEREVNPYILYQELWKNFILPSYDEIVKEKWDDAKKCYISMVKMLCERYQVAVQEDIMKKYGITIE